MDNNDETRLKYILNELSKLPFVRALILFGSQVNGMARQDSDIDIAVLTKNLSKQQETKILGYSNDKVDISLFNKLPLIIQFRIIKDGKIVFCRDKKYLHETKYNTIKKYLDFAGFINKFYRRVIQNV